MTAIDDLFEADLVIGVPSLADEYATRSSGVQDDQAGDKCD